jgi:putative transposase
MKRLQAYKFEIMLNGLQAKQMTQSASSCRFVFNQARAWQNAQYQADNNFKFSYVNIANLLPAWKAEHSWLKDAPS